MNALLLKAGIAVAVLVGACVATWFAASAHYSQALTNLEGQLKAGAAAQRAAVQQQEARDQAASKEVDSEAQQQIGSMAAVISDLSVRNVAVRVRVPASRSAHPVCPAPASAPVAGVQPDRPAAAASPGPDRPAAQPTQSADAALDAAVLGGILDVAADSLKAELLWRKYARQTGQTK